MNRRVNRYTASSTGPLPGLLFVLLSAVFGAWLAWDALVFRLVTYVPWADYWEHTAVLAEWLRNFAAPANPHVDDPSLSARFMPYFWLLTYAGRMFGFDAVQLMSLSAVSNYVLIVLGLKLFLETYFRNRWAPVIGFIVIFMFWGVGWNWSNLYQLRSFFYVAGYPSTFVFGLSLVSFWAMLRLLRGTMSVVIAAPMLGLLAALMFLCHPLTAVFGVVGCILLLATEPVLSRVNAALGGVALLAGLGLAEFWPFFSVWKLAFGLYGGGLEQWSLGTVADGTMSRFASGDWAHVFYNPRLVVNSLGLSLLGVPLVAWLFIRREHMFIVLGSIVMLVPYALNLFVEIPLAHRFLLFAVTYLQLAIVWGWLELIEAWDELPRPFAARPLLLASIAVGLVVIAANVWLLNIEFDGKTLSSRTLQVVDKRTATPGGIPTLDLYKRLLEPLDDDAVVLTTARMGWPVPTVKGKVVSLYHENPLLPDQLARYEDTGDFFYKAITDIRRVEIIQHYGATYALTSDDDTAISASANAWLNTYAMPVAEVGGYRMYKLSPALFEIELPVTAQTQEPPAAVASEDNAAIQSAPAKQNARPSVREARPERRTPVSDEATDVEESAPLSFGAPIAQPMLDPERHGA